MTTEARTHEVDEARLDRFEQRLDRLAEAFATLARMEERMLNSNQKVERLEALLSSQAVRLDDVTLKMTATASSSRVTEKAFWLLLGSVVAYIATVIGA